MKRSFVIIALALAFNLFMTPNSQAQSKSNSRDVKTSAAIRAVLDAQVAAWNRGDIEGFMDGYARSPNIVFVSGDSLTHGWQTVLDRYKKGYDTREKMGTLAFSDLEIKLISKDAAVVNGRWQLNRDKDTPHGRFTLIFRRAKAGWRIVHDHTSSAS
jgi:ketosteroid isomerase-like protein